MNVIVVCEFSGIVRDAFIKKGHKAVSCDLIPSESGFGPHIQSDCREIDYSRFDLAVCHPPCTYLCSSGARWWSNRRKEQCEAVAFVKFLFSIPVKRIAIENPVGFLSTALKKPDQIIHPWWFGESVTKATCLWLKNLPLLKASDPVEPLCCPVHWESPSKDRWKNRSRTYQVVADAMADQWS